MHSLYSGSRKRADHAMKKKYSHAGRDAAIRTKNIPRYSGSGSFHNNIVLGGDGFSVFMIPSMAYRTGCREKKGIVFDFKERIGCIEIMDNCFLGANAVSL